MARTRQRDSGSFTASATRTFDGFKTTRTYAAQSRDICTDSTGGRIDHGLLIEHRNMTVEAIQTLPGHNWQVSGNFLPNQFAAGARPLVTVLSNLPSYNATLLAKTNPSRPVVDIPVFVFELGDLPKLVRLAGRSMIEKASSANLAYQFGWKPLLGDLANLIQFTDMVAKRQRELERLYSKNGLKRRARLGSNVSLLNTSNINIESVVANIFSKYSQRTTENVWGTVRWKPSSLPSIEDPKHRTAAFRAVLGLDLTASTVWEALPWSWLVDWFTNVGDILMASRNTIPAFPTGVCIMRTTVCTRTWESATGPTVKWGGGTETHILKERAVGSALGLTASLPFLSMTRLSILGSLSVLKSKAFR